MQLPNITHAPGDENMPGLAQEFWYTEKENITGWPSLGTTVSDRAVYTGAFTFATGTCWSKWYNTLETAKLTNKQVGEKDCRNYENAIEWKTPGSAAALVGAMGATKNRNLVFICREAGSGKMRIVGSELFGASVEEGSEDGGMKGTDYKGFSMKVVSRH